MLIAHVITRLVLIAVFVTAGFAKLMDRAGSREALIGFGLPGWLARPLGILLPIAELAVAALLISVTSVRLGAIGALALLLAFVIAISINLAQGRAPDCHCFGQLHSAPAGWSTLGRNAVLGCAAGFLVWQGRQNPVPSLVSWFGDMTNPQRVAVIGGILGLALLLQIVRQQGRILVRLDALEAHPGGATNAQSRIPTVGLPLGFRAPSFRLKALEGETVTLEHLIARQRPVLLLFTNPNCGPCQALLPEVRGWQQEHRAKLTIALVSEGSVADNRVKTAEQGVNQILLQQKREVAETYEAWGTPAAVLVLPDGNIGSPVAQGADSIRTLVEQAAAGRMPVAAAPNSPHANGHHSALPAALKPGDPAPQLKLRDVRGRTVPLSAFRGHNTLILFWNPGCGFCQRMLNDLKEWDSLPPSKAPKLLVLFTGSAEEARAMGLRSSVLLDPSSQAAAAFGIHGTPMAVLVDANGRIGSEVAAGAEAVFALANPNPTEAQLLDIE